MAPAVLPPRARPLPLIVALVVVLLEALALAVGGVVLIVAALTGGADNTATALGMGAFAWLFAGLLVVAGRALWRLRRWARGPLVTWQLLQGLVGVTLLPGAPLFGAALLVAALVALAGMLAPRSLSVSR